MTRCQIVLADDHVILRQGLRRMIEDSAEMEVIGEAGDGLELIRLVHELSPDLVILDISMPHLRGIEAIHEIKATHPRLKVVVLTMHGEIDFLTAAMAAGANGYVLKEDAQTQLFAAVVKVLDGGTYISPKLTDDMMHDWARGRRGDANPAGEAERLTVREREVLKLTAEGKSNREISGLLCISLRTVEHHRAHIMTKLNLRKTADVVRYALHEGYL